jgi:2-(1,2-epoxy-1,2-dihydrophenyl)acetyl-CoA isomerase
MSLYEDLREQGAAEKRTLVHAEREGDRVTITLSDPDRLNSLSAALNLQLQERLDEIASEPHVKSVIITGEDPGFSAGGDLEIMAAGNQSIRDSVEPSDTTDPWRWIRNQFGGVVRTISSTDKLFVAAINGPAAGVGLAFALACDVIVASERAVLVPAFGRIGLVPEVGTSWLLTRRLGYHGTVAYYLRGRHITASEALEFGLVQEVYPHEELLAGAASWCDLTAKLPSHAFAMTKSLLRAVADAPWEQALKLEEFAEANCFSTASLGEAIAELRAGR